MENLSNAVTDDVIPMLMEFLQATVNAVQETPIASALLLALALTSAVLARSILLLVPTATLAVLSILLSDASAGSQRLIPLVLGVVGLLIVCAWTMAIRGRFARLKGRLKSSIEAHAATKELLDREIAWRQAAEDERLA